jgi:hypothetical protein
MNNKQQQIIDEVYENYVNWWEYDDNSVNLSDKESEKWLKLVDGGLQWGVLSKEEFINKCKTDPEFSGKWGLKIEERELSLEERIKVGGLKYNHKPSDNGYTENDEHRVLDEINIPTKIITITYKEQTIESYE